MRRLTAPPAPRDIFAEAKGLYGTVVGALRAAFGPGDTEEAMDRLEAARKAQKPKFLQGDTLCCPACGSRVATAKRDVMGDEPVDPAVWEWHQHVAMGFKCEPCKGRPIYRAAPAPDGRGMGIQLHSLRGWL